MAAVDARICMFPVDFTASSTNFAGFSVPMDSSTDACAFLFQPFAAISIARLGFRIHAVSASAPPIYRVSLQGIDASGMPDGTIKGGGSPASATFDVNGSGWAAGEWHWVTLSNAYSCAKGEWLAMVVDYSSGTVGASNNITLTAQISDTYNWSFPNIRINTGASWAKVASSSRPVFGYGTGSVAYGLPAETFGTTSFGSTTEHAMRFMLPAGMGSTFTLRGVRFHGNIPVATTTDIHIYDASADTDSDPIASITVDGDAMGNAPSNDTYIIIFDDTPTLNFGQAYRISFLPSSATSNAVYWLDVDAAEDMEAWPLGQECYAQNRANQTASWTSTTTRRYVMDLLIDDITEPAGGGGASIFTQRRRVA